MQKILDFLKRIFSSSSNIYIFIIVGLMIYIFLFKPSSNSKIDQIQHKIDSINVDVDTLKKKVLQIDPQLDNNKKSIDTVKKIIHFNDLKLQDIQKSAKKRDSVINSFTSDQLQKYFSEY